jgi:S-adenosylmethionine:tRNA ribosyltransferase-isomerase
MDLGVLDYALDPALIAQQPLPTRDASRLLVVDRTTARWTHDVVRNVDAWLRPGDVLVANDAEVIAARLYGTRPTGGTIEVLLVEPLDDDRYWRCVARGAGRVPLGEDIVFGDGITGTWGERLGDVFRAIRIRCEGDLGAALRRVGEIPLPPYIRRPDGPSATDGERYQTMFARTPGAVAAPTAGLHFTPDLIGRLAAGGVSCVALTLIVGPATFLPIRGDSLQDHSVPPERYAIALETAEAINAARAGGGRIVAIGTTTARALESAVTDDGVVTPGEGRTALVIQPGHRFRAVDALFTNFHLPRSSLLALVAAFAGTDTTLAAYRAAAASSYRFYSYGDAMLVV